MKGPYGFVLAVLLGLFAFVLNVVYLMNKSREFPSETFLAIKDDITIREGDVIKGDHLVSVKIPLINRADALKQTAYLYEELPTVTGMVATREYRGGDLIYRRDYQTPVDQLVLKPDEGLTFLSASRLSFEPGLVDPGDRVTFLATPIGESEAVMEPANGEIPPAVDVAADAAIPLGTFVVASLGERINEKNLSRDYRMRQGSERTVGIIVKMDGLKPEPRALRLIQFVDEGRHRITVIVQKAGR